MKNVRGKNRTKNEIDNNFEDAIDMQEFIDHEDYSGLIQFCIQRAEENPDDLYAQYYLGDAYVRNGEYEKAIEFIAEHYKKQPWNIDYQYIILDALFALGKTEDDFIWDKNPIVLRMSPDIVNRCYEYLKRKRKARYIIELHCLFITEGYILFSEMDLLNALLYDERFIVDNPEDEIYAEVLVVKKKNK